MILLLQSISNLLDALDLKTNLKGCTVESYLRTKDFILVDGCQIDASVRISL